jgi:hypothetical protein
MQSFFIIKNSHPDSVTMGIAVEEIHVKKS